MNEAGRLHAATWAWWALAAVVTVQLAPNPTYVAVVVAISVLVVETHAPDGGLARAFPLVLAVAVLFVGVRVVLEGLTTHPATGDVLVRLPAFTLPVILGGFTVGGTVHATVLLRAATDGFLIVGVVAPFAAFNAVVSHHELVRSAPRAFHELGLVLTVALTFVPSTLAAIAAVREADRARTGGRSVRRGRLLRVAVPILESGMERAMHLAESMDARGFGRLGPDAPERAAGWLAFGGLICLAGTFVALVGRARTVATALALTATAAVAAAVAVASRASRRPRHRARRPTRADALAAAFTTVAPVAVAWLAFVGEPTLRWRIGTEPLPGFDPLVVLAFAPLAIPAVGRPRLARASPEAVA
ncbi:MAG TPA: energy-coupling factor transporter transmembrane component T [Nitriliruptorales bacterium]|nr:energy-coupling factor transporter transmembrane component T [Nitriliruptorales bacterium]